MKSYITSVVVFVLLLAGAGAAWAGYKANSYVSVKLSSRTASGGLGSARNSSDGNQYIGCSVSASTNALSISCSARDSAGNFLTCWSNSAQQIQAVLSLNSDGFLSFTADASGYCTSIYVDGMSFYPPKNP